MTHLSQALRSAPFLILFSMALILIEFNIPTAFSLSFGRPFNARDPLMLSFMVFYSLVFLFLLPMLVNQLVLKQELAYFGLRKPRKKIRTVLLILAVFLVLVPGTVWLANLNPMQAFYSLKGLSGSEIAFDLFLAFPPYYFAEEFFFRGFLFLPLFRKIGWHSYWITELIFTWAHLGKPPIEILYSFPAGLVLNYLTLKTKSIYPAMGVHYFLGVGLTLYVTFIAV